MSKIGFWRWLWRRRRKRIKKEALILLTAAMFSTAITLFIIAVLIANVIVGAVAIPFFLIAMLLMEYMEYEERHASM